CGSVCRPRGCGVAQHVGEALGRLSPPHVRDSVAVFVAPGGEVVPGWIPVAPPLPLPSCAQTRSVLSRCAVAGQEAEGEVSACFSSLLRTCARRPKKYDPGSRRIR
ncbi:MAG: hypothetical protein ACK56I_00495, partial [bacterium]